MYKDKILKCKDCGADFEFTAGEQEFYAEKGFNTEPIRCRSCRVVKKQTLKRHRETFEIICAKCRKIEKIPFEPRHEIPIYCDECYAAIKASTVGTN